MKIAYLILIHKGLDQFIRLFKSIYHPDNYYLIHVDRKSDTLFNKGVEDFSSIYSNCHIMRSYKCTWGGYSMVDIELKGINELLSIHDWKFLINMSGQDFPLRSQEYIKDYLNTKTKSNFVHIIDQRKDWPESLFRIEHIFWEVRSNIRQLPLLKRQFFKGVNPYAGSQWFILNREFCEFVFFNKAVNKFKEFYRRTYIPDEAFFQTVIMNSEYKSTVINDNKRAITWLPGGKLKTYTIDDFDYLIETENFFARKFDESVDSTILDRLEQRLCAALEQHVNQKSAGS